MARSSGWQKLAGSAMLCCCWWCCWITAAESSSSPSIGVNWGTFESVEMDPRAVVEMLEANGIGRVKLFDAHPGILSAFRNSKIELIVGLPNDKLQLVATLPAAARTWVRKNITRYLRQNVNIKCVAVGNEPFLKSYNGSYQPLTYPALVNIQAALYTASDPATRGVMATVPMNADVLAETAPMLPSAGTFRPDATPDILRIATALSNHSSPFTINIYPFLSLAQDPFFPIEFAFLHGAAPPLVDGDHAYPSAFLAAFDAVAAALARIGYPDLAIVVGETGWPTEGHPAATIANAQRFNQQLIDHVLSGDGSPRRQGPLEVFLFALIDEDRKPIAAGPFERHWGIFASDGYAKYPIALNFSNLNSNLNLNGASSRTNMAEIRAPRLPSRWCVLNPDVGDLSIVGKNMEYACSYADCTPLMFGGSCNAIGGDGNASFAFNSFFQINQQERRSCHFDGMGMITEEDPSMGDCIFRIGIQSSGKKTKQPVAAATVLAMITLYVSILFSQSFHTSLA